jgi:fumarate hydratase, class II
MPPLNRSHHWGEQTDLALQNFGVSGEVFPLPVIREIAAIKSESAKANATLGRLNLDPADVQAVIDAADAVSRGEFDEEFPIDVFQTGSGTSSNMNVNEVVASVAMKLARTGTSIHPNDHVNASQSSNDVVPSAVHLAVGRSVQTQLLPGAAVLTSQLRLCAVENKDVVKIGRTHLMDAVPVTLGQEFGGMARSIELSYARIVIALDRLMELPLGGTAIGTGLNAPPGFAVKVIEGLRIRTGMPWVEAVDHFEAQANRDALVEMSAACRGLAISMFKIANDLRWMASGPVGGLCEIVLPTRQAGSSIMAGKINPVIPEVVCQVSAQVVGNDAAVAFAGTTGSFELNAMVPVIARNVLQSVRLLSGAMNDLASKCLRGLVANETLMRDRVTQSSMVATGLNELFGYEKTKSLVEESERTGTPVAVLVVSKGWLDETSAKRILDPLRLAHPHR